MQNLTITTYSETNIRPGRATLIGTDKDSVKPVYVITTMFNILHNSTQRLDEELSKDYSLTDLHKSKIHRSLTILFVIGSNVQLSELDFESDYTFIRAYHVFIRLIKPMNTLFDFSMSRIKIAGSFFNSEEQSVTRFTHFEVDCYKINYIIWIPTPCNDPNTVYEGQVSIHNITVYSSQPPLHLTVVYLIYLYGGGNVYASEINSQIHSGSFYFLMLIYMDELCTYNEGSYSSIEISNGYFTHHEFDETPRDSFSPLSIASTTDKMPPDTQVILTNLTFYDIR